MPIPFRCQQCNATGKAGSRFAGTLITCPRCGAMVKVPATAEATEAAAIEVLQEKRPAAPPAIEATPAATPVLPQETPPLKPAPRTQRRWPFPSTVLLVAGAVAWIVTLTQPPGPLSMLHYAGLMTAVVASGYRLATMTSLGWAATAGWGAAIAAALLWRQYDVFVQRWEKQADDGSRLIYYDWKRRGEWKPYYREFLKTHPDGNIYSAEGEFSDSGKQHGEWESYTSGVGIEHQWYWYGEPIKVSCNGGTRRARACYCPERPAVVGKRSGEPLPILAADNWWCGDLGPQVAKEPRSIVSCLTCRHRTPQLLLPGPAVAIRRQPTAQA